MAQSRASDKRAYFWILVAGLLGYEAWTLADEAEGNTVSEIMWEIAARRPLLPFAMGLLMGHFFWQRTVVRSASSSSPATGHQAAADPPQSPSSVAGTSPAGS